MSSLHLQRYVASAKVSADEETQLDESGPILAPLPRPKDRIKFDPRHYHAANTDHYEQMSTRFISQGDAEDHVKEHGGHIHKIGHEYHVVKHPVQKRSEMSSSAPASTEKKTNIKDTGPKKSFVQRVGDLAARARKAKTPAHKLLAGAAQKAKGLGFVKKEDLDYQEEDQLDEGLLDAAKARLRKGSRSKRLNKLADYAQKRYDRAEKKGDSHSIYVATDLKKDIYSKKMKGFGWDDRRRLKIKTGHGVPHPDLQKNDVDLDAYIDSLIAEGLTDEEIKVFLESIDLEENRQERAHLRKVSKNWTGDGWQGDIGRKAQAIRKRDAAEYLAKKQAKKAQSVKEELEAAGFTEDELNHLLAIESSDANEKNMRGSETTEKVKTNDIEYKKKKNLPRKKDTTTAGD